MTKVDIFTDGSCYGNPGPGGWASILIIDSMKFQLSGSEENTSNNRMELVAVIEALKVLESSCWINVYSDCEVIVNAFKEGLIFQWMRNDWRRANGKYVRNKDLWQKLLRLCRNHKVYWHYVKGHSGDKFNEHCNEFAKTEALNKLLEGVVNIGS